MILFLVKKPLILFILVKKSLADYDATFYMAGALFIGAGIISELAHIIYLVKEKKRQKEEDDQITKS